MTDQLRRLDALFQERVVGREAAVSMIAGITPNVPRYTRSLNAVWEGVELIGLACLMHSDNPTSPKYLARVSTLKREHEIPLTPFHLGEGRSDHPAEALVLACLRAVGCSEEELT